MTDPIDELQDSDPPKKEDPESQLAALDPKEKLPRTVEITVLGTDDVVSLSVAAVAHIVASPTRLGKLPELRDILAFMQMCKAKGLNPYAKDAFLVGYDCADGSAKWSIIVAVASLLKRAEYSANYEGSEAGILIAANEQDAEDPEKAAIELQGSYLPKGESLVGGWARVYRKDRISPSVWRVNFETYTTGKSRWLVDGSGMIRKCAFAGALREAFPVETGGLYIQEEMDSATVRDVTPGKAPKTESDDSKMDLSTL